MTREGRGILRAERVFGTPCRCWTCGPPRECLARRLSFYSVHVSRSGLASSGSTAGPAITLQPLHSGHGIGLPVEGVVNGAYPASPQPCVRTVIVAGHETRPRPRQVGQVRISLSPASLSIAASMPTPILPANGHARENLQRPGRVPSRRDLSRGESHPKQQHVLTRKATSLPAMRHPSLQVQLADQLDDDRPPMELQSTPLDGA
jgi:hypothetical protein